MLSDCELLNPLLFFLIQLICIATSTNPTLYVITSKTSNRNSVPHMVFYLLGSNGVSLKIPRGIQKAKSFGNEIEEKRILPNTGTTPDHFV